MPRTQLTSREIGSVQRNDIDTSTTGQALITKILPGTGISLSSTGVDAGTGDVTINATTYSGTNFILNQTTQQASANFNIDGSGTIGGVLTVNSSIYTLGSGMVRVEGNAGAGAPTGSAGIGLELFSQTASASYVTSYNRTTSVYAPLVYYASLHTFSGGNMLVGYTTSQGPYIGQFNGGVLVSGNLGVSGSSAGIGTVNPTFVTGGGLEIYNATDVRLRLTNPTVGTSAGGGGTELAVGSTGQLSFINRYATGEFAWYPNNTERMRLTYDGKLLVGYTTSQGSYVGQFNGAIWASGLIQAGGNLVVAGTANITGAITSTGTISSNVATNSGSFIIGGTTVLSATTGALLTINAGGFTNVNIASGNLLVGYSASQGSYIGQFNGGIYIGKNSTYSDDGTAAAISIRTVANSNLRLNIGYDSTTGFAYIQPINNGIAWTNLNLNPNGGKVGIGATGSDLQSPLTVVYGSGSDGISIAHTANFTSGAENGINFIQDATSAGTKLGRIASYFDGTSMWGMKFYGYNGTASAVGMTLTGDGKLLVGYTAAPQSTPKVQVNGGIWASGVIENFPNFASGTSGVVAAFGRKSSWATNDYERLQLGFSHLDSIYNGSTWDFAIRTGSSAASGTEALRVTGDQKLLVGYTASQGSYIAQFGGGILVGGQPIFGYGGHTGVGTTVYNISINPTLGYSNRRQIAASYVSGYGDGYVYSNLHFTNDTTVSASFDGRVSTEAAVLAKSQLSLFFDGTVALVPSISANVLIGTTSNLAGYRLQVNGATYINGNLALGGSTSSSTASPIAIDLGGTYSSAAGANLKLKLYNDGTNVYGLGVSANQLDYVAAGASSHVFYGNGAEQFRIGTTSVTAAAGKINLGSGTFPSWNSSIPNIIQSNLSSFSIGSGTDGAVFLTQNSYLNSAGTSWIYSGTAAAAQYYMSVGTHVWRVAPSGTAGGTNSWTGGSMTFDNSGKLLVGYASSQGSYAIQANGSVLASGVTAMSGISIGTQTFNGAINIDYGTNSFIKFAGNVGGGIYSINSYIGFAFAAAGLISDAGAEDIIIRTPSTKKIRFTTNGGTSTEMMFDAGKLLVGYTSSQGSYLLQVNGSVYSPNTGLFGVVTGGSTANTPVSGGGAISMGGSVTAGYAWLHTWSSLPLTFGYSGTELMRLLNDGKFLVGYTASQGSYVGQFNGNVLANGGLYASGNSPVTILPTALQTTANTATVAGQKIILYGSVNTDFAGLSVDQNGMVFVSAMWGGAPGGGFGVNVANKLAALTIDKNGAAVFQSGVTINSTLTATAQIKGQGHIQNITPTKTAAYTVAATDYTIFGDVTAGGFTVTLPTAVGRAGQIYVIKKVDSSVNTLTVAAAASETIDGVATYLLSGTRAFIIIQSNGAVWYVISKG
jgi:hypothetical protein